jgi:peptide deformylase
MFGFIDRQKCRLQLLRFDITTVSLTLSSPLQRHTQIKVKAQDVNGKAVRFTIQGFAARVFQHEYDHLRGTLFPDRMLREHLYREQDKLRRLEQEYVKAHPGIEFKSILATL